MGAQKRDGMIPFGTVGSDFREGDFFALILEGSGVGGACTWVWKQDVLGNFILFPTLPSL